MRVAVFCVVASVSGIVRIASADSPVAASSALARPSSASACEHLDRGIKFFDLGMFDKAVMEFMAGAALEPTPVFDYDLAQAYRNLRNYENALFHYERFLSRGQPKGKLRDIVIGYVSELRTRLETVPGNSAKEPAVTTAPVPTAPPASVPPQRQAAPRTAPRTGHDWLGLGLVSTGVVALGAGGYLFYRASQLDDQVGLESDMQKRDALRTGVRNRLIAGGITGGAGALLVVTGLLRMALHHDEQPDAGTWAVTATSDSVLVRWSF